MRSPPPTRTAFSPTASKKDCYETPLLVIVLAAVALTGCTSSGDEHTNTGSGDANSSVLEAEEGMAQCMRNLGWDVQVLADGSVSSSYLTPKKDAFETDYDVCKRLHVS